MCWTWEAGNANCSKYKAGAAINSGVSLILHVWQIANVPPSYTMSTWTINFGSPPGILGPGIGIRQCLMRDYTDELTVEHISAIAVGGMFPTTALLSAKQLTRYQTY